MHSISIGDVYLAGDPTKSPREISPCSGFAIRLPRQTQRQSGVHWPHNQMVDRANALFVVSFSVLRRFASPALALLFCADYHAAHAWAGTVRMTTVAGVSYDLAGAVITRPVRTPEGATVMLSYTITGETLSLVEEEE